MAKKDKGRISLYERNSERKIEKKATEKSGAGFARTIVLSLTLNHQTEEESKPLTDTSSFDSSPATPSSSLRKQVIPEVFITQPKEKNNDRPIQGKTTAIFGMTKAKWWELQEK